MNLLNRARELADKSPFRTYLLKPSVRSKIASIGALRFLAAIFVTADPLKYLWAWVKSGENLLTVHLKSGGTLKLNPRRDLETLYEVFLQRCYEPPKKIVFAQPQIVLDVGANIGAFSAFARQLWPNTKIISFEPDPENAELYRSTSAGNDASTNFFEAAAATKDGLLSFRSSLGSGSHVTETHGDESIAVDCLDIFPYLDIADFAKIDIEGAEWPILTDPRLSGLSAITIVLEFHRVGAPSLPAGEAAAALLEEAGFTTVFGNRNYWGQGIIWASKI